MSAQRTTFGKLQRERDKQAKAQAKRERRQIRDEQGVDTAPDASTVSDESEEVILDQIADLHRRFERATISFDEFERRNAELLKRLPIH